MQDLYEYIRSTCYFTVTAFSVSGCDALYQYCALALSFCKDLLVLVFRDNIRGYKYHPKMQLTVLSLCRYRWQIQADVELIDDTLTPS
jgi:hypothetical protein